MRHQPWLFHFLPRARGMVAVLAALALLGPPPANAADPVCSLTATSIAYACVTPGTIRRAPFIKAFSFSRKVLRRGRNGQVKPTTLHSKVYVAIEAFQYNTGLSSMSQGAPSFSRACVALNYSRELVQSDISWSDWNGGKHCDTPLEISFDSLLRSARIKGTWSSGVAPIKTIAFDLSLAATGTPSSDPTKFWQYNSLACTNQYSYTQGVLMRPASVSGSIRFSALSKSFDAAGGDALIEETAVAQHAVIAANGCPQTAPEWMTTYTPFAPVRFAVAAGRAGAMNFAITAAQMDGVGPAATQPVHRSANETWVCLHAQHAMDFISNCNFDDQPSVNIDPALRSATLRAHLHDGNPYWTGYYTIMTVPPELDFGSVDISLSFAPTGVPSIATDQYVKTDTECSPPPYSSPWDEVAPQALVTNAAAAGVVKFQYRYSKVSASPDHALAGLMQEGLYAATDALNPCASRFGEFMRAWTA